MSASDFACRGCGVVLGQVKPSKVLHPHPDRSVLIFVDNIRRTVTFRCVYCGATIVFRGGRIEFDERRTA